MAQYFAHNGALGLTNSPVSVALPAGSDKTVLQLLTPATADMRVFAWGVSFDGTAAAVPVKCGLITTGSVAATVTPFTAPSLMLFSEATAPASLAVLSTTGSGFNATAEGTPTVVRVGDLQYVPPTSGYSFEWADGREFYVPISTVLRIRCTAAAVVNCYAWVRWRE